MVRLPTSAKHGFKRTSRKCLEPFTKVHQHATLSPSQSFRRVGAPTKEKKKAKASSEKAGGADDGEGDEDEGKHDEDNDDDDDDDDQGTKKKRKGANQSRSLSSSPPSSSSISTVYLTHLLLYVLAKAPKLKAAQATAKAAVTVRRVQRQKRKYVTVVAGLKTCGKRRDTPIIVIISHSFTHTAFIPLGVETKKASKAFATHFSCSASITQPDEVPQE